ncbi:AAA family ATPase [Faecalimicrobium sp. JNUCC 81]
MKPVSLKITAFGPYAKTTTLNFKEDLKNQNIFVITGPTGSGKTTIFDAICYALYGQTSGNKRNGEQLRSDFVGIDGDKTEVEFTFSVRNKEYFIKRSPKQKRKSKRGNKEVEDSASVEFKALDSDNAPLTKDKDVNEKVLSVIGLNVEQFRKIVMIPQGDFREFLYANTSVKEEILRKIFGTDIYKKVQERLSEETTVLSKDVEHIRNDINSILKVVKCSQDSELYNMIKNDELHSKIIDKLSEYIEEEKLVKNENVKIIEDLNLDIKNKNDKINKSTVINDKFNAKEAEEIRLNNLKQKENEFKIKCESLKKYKKALDILVHEENYLKEDEEKKKLENTIKITQEELDRCLVELDKITQMYNQIEEKQKEKEKINIDLNNLMNYIKDVNDIDLKANSISKLTKNKEEIEKKQNSYKFECENLEKEIDTFINKQEELFKCKQEKIELENINKNYAILRDKLLNLYNYAKDYNAYYSELDKETIKEENLEKEINKLKEQEQVKIDLFINGEAIRLAKHLKEGCECPVCGSTSHPNKRTANEDIPTKKDLDEFKNYINSKEKEKEILTKNKNDLQSKLIGLKTYIKEMFIELVNEKIFTNDDKVLDYTNTVLPKGKEIKLKIDETNTKLKTLEANIILLEKEIKDLNDKKEKLKTRKEELVKIELEVKKISDTLIGEQNSYNEILKRVPQKYHSLEILNLDINTLSKELNDIEAYIKSVRNNYDEISKKKITIQSGLDNLKNNLDNTLSKLELLKSKFENLVKENFSSLEEYNLSKIDENIIDNLDKEINKYNEELTVSIRTVENLSKELVGLTIVNLDNLKDELNVLETNKEALDSKIKELNLNIVDNEKILIKIKKDYNSIKEKEDQYKLVADLSKLANGSSQNKVSFETFVLSSYFEDVIIEANKRLQSMTSKRYYLLRREENKGGGRKGLDLDVYDSHTCKSRPVNTLSGGESFKASLALALGLSDTVQHNSGGIRLDTMFIDEGFGTLDSESLDNAIDTLMELQDNGRIIGVISHVNELKERIPSKLIVEMDTKGSKAYFNKI